MLGLLDVFELREDLLGVGFADQLLQQGCVVKDSVPDAGAGAQLVSTPSMGIVWTVRTREQETHTAGLPGTAQHLDYTVRLPLQKRSREAWERILGAGVDRLCQGGYDAFTIAAVCDWAGAPPRAI